VTHEFLSIDAQSKIHVEKFQFDEPRISECLQYVTTNFNLLCVLLSLFCVGRAVRYVTNGSTYQKSSIVVRLFGNTDSKAASGDREVTKKGAYCREMASL